MKITFIGTFTIDDVKLINEFLEIQETTDRERENTVIDYDGEIEIKVKVDKNSDIVKINFRKRKENNGNDSITTFGSLSFRKE